MRIREAQISEAEAIAALVNVAFQVERTFKNGDRTTAAEITQMFSTGRFLVSEQDETVCLLGAVFVRITGQTGYFGLLSIAPTSQRSGIGRTLMQAAESYCQQRGCKQMTLRTVDAREDLPGYYARFGYEETSREPVPPGIPFTKPVQFVNMAKPLD